MLTGVIHFSHKELGFLKIPTKDTPTVFLKNVIQLVFVRDRQNVLSDSANEFLISFT
jgi:hypothetical protein